MHNVLRFAYTQNEIIRLLIRESRNKAVALASIGLPNCEPDVEITSNGDIILEWVNPEYRKDEE